MILMIFARFQFKYKIIYVSDIIYFFSFIHFFQKRLSKISAIDMPTLQDSQRKCDT